jgi:hypothetical protein
MISETKVTFLSFSADKTGDAAPSFSKPRRHHRKRAASSASHPLSGAVRAEHVLPV